MLQDYYRPGRHALKMIIEDLRGGCPRLEAFMAGGSGG
jgi:hypothetical protein